MKRDPVKVIEPPIALPGESCNLRLEAFMPIDSRLSSAPADRYRLERQLGAGGIAFVYLADDIRHRRKVAVGIGLALMGLAAVEAAEGRAERAVAIAAAAQGMSERAGVVVSTRWVRA